MGTIPTSDIHIGKDSQVAPDVQLGVLPKHVREGKDTKLVIGDDAVLRSGAIIYAGTIVGNNFSAGHNAFVREYVRVGNDVSIGTQTEIEQDVIIGNGVRIHSKCFIAEGTEFEDNVKLAPGVMVASDLHPLLPEEKKKRKGPIFKKGVYVGIGAIFIPGITIGEGSFVAAGSLVTKDVPPGTVVRGSPARVVSTMQAYLDRLHDEK